MSSYHPERPILTRRNGQRNLFNPINQYKGFKFSNNTKKHNSVRPYNPGPYYPTNKNNRQLRNSRLAVPQSSNTRTNAYLDEYLSKLFANITSNTNSTNVMKTTIANLYKRNYINANAKNSLLKRLNFLYSINS